MILRNMVLNKVESAYTSPYAFLDAFQSNSKMLSADDKSVIDGLVIIGHNLIELELPLMDDVYLYRGVSDYVLDRLTDIFDKCNCKAVLFMMEIIDYVLDYAKPLRRLA